MINFRCRACLTWWRKEVVKTGTRKTVRAKNDSKKFRVETRRSYHPMSSSTTLVHTYFFPFALTAWWRYLFKSLPEQDSLSRQDSLSQSGHAPLVDVSLRLRFSLSKFSRDNSWKIIFRVTWPLLSNDAYFYFSPFVILVGLEWSRVPNFSSYPSKLPGGARWGLFEKLLSFCWELSFETLAIVIESISFAKICLQFE